METSFNDLRDQSVFITGGGSGGEARGLYQGWGAGCLYRSLGRQSLLR